MGIAMQTAIRELDKKKAARLKRFPVFRLTLTRRPHVGETENLLIAAENERAARCLALSLYGHSELPRHLQKQISTLADVCRFYWSSKKEACCAELPQKRTKRGVIKIGVRKS